MVDIFLRYMTKDDQSIGYLSLIFGSMNGVIQNPNAASPGPIGGNLTILGTMFHTFNSVILAIAALMVVYTTVVGVMMTAHEGEFMKKWNSLWTPIRTVLGVAALVPTGAGYSGIQIIMMWVIVQGIGAADFMWSTVLNYITVVGSPFTQSSIPSTSINQNLTTLFQSMTCIASARVNKAAPLSQLAPYKGWGGDYPDVSSATTTSKAIDMGPGGGCGTLTICDQSTTGSCATPDSISCLACKAQLAALANIIPTFRNIAELFVQVDYDYQTYYANSYFAPNPNGNPPTFIKNYCSEKKITPCSVIGGIANPVGNDTNAYYNASNEVISQVYYPYAFKPTLGDDNFVSTATKYYTDQLGQAFQAYIERYSNTNTLDADLQKAKNSGWIFAGAYYYTVAGWNKANATAAAPTFTVNADPSSSGDMSGYRTNFTAASTLVNASSTTGSQLPQSVQQFSGVYDQTSFSIGNAFSQLLTGSAGADKLASLQSFGSTLITIATILYAVILVMVFALAIIGNLSVYVLGTGFNNPIGPTVQTISILFVPILIFVLGIMLSLGATLSIYLPLIPYTIFTIGAIGWLTSCIEAMVAGPLVALGILSPGGHHEILGKAEPALMLLFNIFLRPTLMIFGLVAAMLLSNVVIIMINYAFFNIVQSSIKGAVGLGFLIYLGAYVTLMVAALNKCFSAINIIPERVMRWIGGQGEQYGEGEVVGEMKRAIEAGAEKTKGTAEAAKGAAAGTQKAWSGYAGDKGDKDHQRGKYAKKEGEETPAVSTKSAETPPGKE